MRPNGPYGPVGWFLVVTVITLGLVLLIVAALLIRVALLLHGRNSIYCTTAIILGIMANNSITAILSGYH